MKTAIVPAQVTTIEDRIAGNFTIAQLGILLLGLGLATLLYLLMSPKLHFNPGKAVAIVTVIALVAPLAIRIQGKIVADWLIVLSRFLSRPHRYIFTKNDLATRAVPIPENKAHIVTQAQPKPSLRTVIKQLSVPDQAKADELLENPGLAVRFVIAEKGGIDVSLTPVKR